MKKCSVIKYKNIEFCYRLYGHRGGRTIEIMNVSPDNPRFIEGRYRKILLNIGFLACEDLEQTVIDMIKDNEEHFIPIKIK